MIKIEIPSSYSGWCYIIGTTNKDVMKKVNDRYVLDKNGIDYIDTSIINSDFNIEYYKNKKLLTDSHVKFFFTTEVNDRDKITLKPIIRRIFLFYVLDNEEIKKGDLFWQDEEHRSPIWDLQEKRQKYLFDKKIIILE